MKSATSKTQYDVARLLTKILRHDANKLKLNIQKNGYIDVNEILQLKGFEEATKETIDEIVKSDKKGRFDLLQEENQTLIRANQGHSLEGIVSDEVDVFVLFV